MMDAVPLDQALVERFKGKVMAIVGYEADQVLIQCIIHLSFINHI